MRAFKSKSKSSVDQIARSHDKRMRDLRIQQSKKLKLLTHQYNVILKSIRQGYTAKIQHLVDQQKSQEVDMLKTTDVAKFQEKVAHTEAQIALLKSAMEQEIVQATAKFEDHVAQLNRSTQQLEESENAREQTRTEHATVTHELETSRKHQEKSEQDLSGTQSKLAAMKLQYEVSVKDLQHALATSQHQLQGDYELITALKKDKSRYSAEVDKLQKKLDHFEAQVQACTVEKKELHDQMQATKMDVSKYKHEMQKLLHVEKASSDAAGKTHQDLEDLTLKLKQSRLAIEQAQKDMEQEKIKHIAIRKEYQNHVDRLVALNEALEKCKEKSHNSQQIIHDMNERYTSLKSRSEQMIQELQKLKDENSGLAVERQKLLKTQQDVDQSRTHMQQQVQKLEQNSHHTSQLMEACHEKGEACLKKSHIQAEHIQKLEGEIKRSLQVLKNEELLHRKVEALTHSATVREKELEQLHHQLGSIKEENRTMKNHIAEFESHHTADEKFQMSHQHLKDKHHKTLTWVEELKAQHEQLYKSHNILQQQLSQTDKKLHEKETALQQSAADVQAQDHKMAELKAKIDKCLYPGQKEIMESQLRDLLREKEAMKAQLHKETNDVAQLHTKMQTLMKENEDLRIIKTRYEMETSQMEKIVEQGAQLNSELMNAKKMIQKKDQQLELLSSQLGTLIHRVKTLEDHETMLQEKLKYSSSPEEVEVLTTNLTNCKLEMKRNAVKFQEMVQIADRLKEQNHLNQNKVGSLVHVLKDTEVAREQLQAEQTQKAELRQALTQCGEDRKISAQQLELRIKAVDDQYRQTLIQHEKVMAESNTRIHDLQKRLQQTIEMERNTRLKAETIEPPPMMRSEQPTNYDQIIANLKKQLAEVEHEKAKHGPKPEVAMKAAALPAVNDLQAVKINHEQVMRAKEKEIMGARHNTYEALLKTLEVANKDPNVSPNDVYSEIKRIRVQGTDREQQATADMLELRAINAKLETEYKAARQVQAELLANANTNQRNRIIQSTQQGPPEVMQSVADYRTLSNTHQDYLSRQKDDVQRQLEYQQQYIKELERQAPLMNSITNQMNLQKFPDLNVFNTQVGKEGYYTMNALNRENKEAMSQDRSISGIEAQIRGLTAQNMMMVQSAKEYAKNPIPSNANALATLAQQSPTQMAETIRRQQMLADNSQVRSAALIGPRDPGLGPPGKTMSADIAKAEIIFRGDNGMTNKYLFDRVLLGGQDSPTTHFAPELARAEASLAEGHDFIAITYGFNAKDAQGIKYQVFKHAVELLYPKIRQLQGTEFIQVVKITPNEGRFDMLNPEHAMTRKCTYTNCNSTKIAIQKDGQVSDILQRVEKSLTDDAHPSENHVVLTFSSTESKSRIHVVDVLFHKINTKVPDINDMKLLDNSWISYLADILSQDPDIKIDLFANLIAYRNGDTESQLANERIVQIADRIKTFLTNIHTR